MKKKLLVFLPRQYYKPKYDLLIENYNDFEITIISKEPISVSEKNISRICGPTFFKMICEIFKIRKTQFDVFLASNIDDWSFGIMFRYLQFSNFHSFDEGQRVLLKEDYYFRKFIPYDKNKRNWLTNKIFGFPLSFMDYFLISKKHYTFYDPEYFDHALKDHPNIEFKQLPRLNHQLSKVFVGTASTWYSDSQFGAGMSNVIHKNYESVLSHAAHQINVLLPDIYLMHPRENNDLINLLDSRISILKNIRGGNENFINMLASLNVNLQVFVEKTGLVYGLDENINITFINLFNRISEESFNSYIKNFKAYRKGNYLNKDPNE